MTTPNNRQGFDALVADDEQGIRDLLVDFLSERGYRVANTGDGRAAVAALERSAGECRLVFTDLSMPDSNDPQKLSPLRPDLSVRRHGLRPDGAFCASIHRYVVPRDAGTGLARHAISVSAPLAQWTLWFQSEEEAMNDDRADR